MKKDASYYFVVLLSKLLNDMSLTTSETKIVRFSVPVFIEELRLALLSEDFLKCKELRDYFYEKYETFEGKLREDFKSFLKLYLEEYQIDPKEELNGVFDQVFEEK